MPATEQLRTHGLKSRDNADIISWGRGVKLILSGGTVAGQWTKPGYPVNAFSGFGTRTVHSLLPIWIYEHDHMTTFEACATAYDHVRFAAARAGIPY